MTDLTRKTFGGLLAIRPGAVNAHRIRLWWVRCLSCKHEYWTPQHALKKNKYGCVTCGRRARMLAYRAKGE